ncbi:hypothetical protein BO99DRAFT_293818, partial [Aspergillus violaceofuscus CBS 115571]
ITYRDGISILQIIVYVPTFISGYFLIWKNSIKQSLGYGYLMVFATLRIIGVCCNLAAINNPSVLLYITVGIYSAIGVSPLISVYNSFFSRASMHCAWIYTFYVLTVVALIITIISFISYMSLLIFQHLSSKIKIGTILFVVAWFMLCILFGILYWKRLFIEKGEQRTLLAVGLSLPFLAVRILYSVLMWFLSSSTFNFINGNPTVELVMSVLEEFAVIIICTGIGLTLKVR